jgi:glycosyltransferase involved in cell wall biosynthesis
MIQTTIVIPAWNEEKGLPVVLKQILAVIDDSYEIIVVDDGSTDMTSEVASKFNCRIVKHEVNKGKGEALKTGVKHSTGENIIWTDADDSYPSELIPKVAEVLRSYDIVVCSRRSGMGNIPLFNRFGNWIFRVMIKGIYGFKPYDPCSGLWGAKKSNLLMMHLSSERFSIEPEIAMKGSRMKLKMLDIPIEYRVRVGETKLNWMKVGFEDLWAIIRLIPWRPERDVNG